VNKPCPFCGNPRAIIEPLNYSSGKPGRFRVKCRDCGGATQWFDAAEQAWGAWNKRSVELSPELKVLIINSDTFIYEGLLYLRNKQSGYCLAQKEFRGSLKQVSEKDFLSTSQKAEIARAERAHTEDEKTTGKVEG
jgi:Lar family restriction alleviation protein